MPGVGVSKMLTLAGVCLTLFFLRRFRLGFRRFSFEVGQVIMIEALLASKLLVVGGKGDLIQPWIVLESNDLRLVASQCFLPISLLGYFGCQEILRVHESRAGHVSRRTRSLGSAGSVR